MKAHCHCCGKTVDARPLCEVENLAGKLTPGDETPAGECTECGSLAYSTDFESKINRASSILQKDYWDDVNRLADSYKENVKQGHITDREQLMERMHEDCGSNGRVIYTHQAKLALVFSDNCDAYEEEYGNDMPEWSQLAYCAFYRDVQDQLEVYECDICGDQLVLEEGGLCKDCKDDEDDNEGE